MDRRTFLKTGSLAFAGVSLPGSKLEWWMRDAAAAAAFLALFGLALELLDLLLELEKSKEGLKIELVYFNDAKLEADFVKQEAGIVDEEAVQQYVELLSASRVKILEKYLHSVTDSTRVIVSFANPQDPKNIGTRPVFRINYSLEEE